MEKASKCYCSAHPAQVIHELNVNEARLLNLHLWLKLHTKESVECPSSGWMPLSRRWNLQPCRGWMEEHGEVYWVWDGCSAVRTVTRVSNETRWSILFAQVSNHVSQSATLAIRCLDQHSLRILSRLCQKRGRDQRRLRSSLVCAVWLSPCRFSRLQQPRPFLAPTHHVVILACVQN